MKTQWQTAKASQAQGECVEQRRNDEPTAPRVEVRHSKRPDDGTLALTPQAYAAWIQMAKAGDLDHLI